MDISYKFYFIDFINSICRIFIQFEFNFKFRIQIFRELMRAKVDITFHMKNADMN